jgi:hypothetical protein
MAIALQNGISSMVIMASDLRQRVWVLLLGPVVVAVVAGTCAPSQANDAVGTLQPPCPRIASPAGQSYLQPARLPPDQVKGKNQLGCLSPADAIYGSDGCPLRFCGSDAGVFPFNPGSPAP